MDNPQIKSKIKLPLEKLYLIAALLQNAYNKLLKEKNERYYCNVFHLSAKYREIDLMIEQIIIKK